MDAQNQQKSRAFAVITTLVISLLSSSTALADDHTGGNTSYVIWLGICAVLVLFMQAGFLMLEGGMVRSKNSINVILKNFTDIGLGTIGFWLFGFAFMFGVNESGWIGLTEFMPSYQGNSDNLNLLYQMMFAATAATIMSGAVAERFSFLPYISGAFLITSVVYPIFGGWAWNDNGWLSSLGFIDDAGGTVVHSIGAWCALGALLFIGPRTGRYSRKGALHTIPGHNLPFVAIGGLILWFGWFGFNGGAVAEDLSNLGKILVNTHLSGVFGIFGAIFVLVASKQGIYATQVVNGALGGLVSVTAGVTTMSAPFACLTAFIGGCFVVLSSKFLARIRIDDVVGAIPVHGFCGAWGTLAAGFFYQGDFFNLERVVAQFVGVAVALIWGVGVSYGLFALLNKLIKVRVPVRFEQRGLDISEHKEIGYNEFVITHARADI